MLSPLNVLIVEDSPDDANLILRELRRAEFDPRSRRVDTEADFLASLHPGLDVIISDYLMPGFNGLQALELLKQRELEIPFIIVSGRIGEDEAVVAMQQGASDYLMKDRMARLGQAVRQALQQARARAERKRADQALQASEELLRNFIKHTPAAVAMFDTEMRYLQASDRWITDYHLEGKDLIGRSHYEVFPDIPERWKEVHRRALGGQSERCDEDMFPRADGGCEWLQWEVRPWHASENTIGGVIFFTQVITERKRIESKLRESEVLFRTSFENATVGVCLVATDGRFLNVNRTLCDMLGYTREELLQLTSHDITHKQDKEIGRAFVANALSGGPKTMQVDKRYLRRDGQVVWAFLSTAFIERSSEHDAYLISNVQDITQRKQAESELAQSNLRLNLAVASGQLAVWEWDLVTDVLVWDERMFQLYGLSNTQFGANYQAWVNAVHPEDREHAEESVHAATRGGPPYDVEFRIVHPNGEVRYIKANGIVVRDDEGRAVRVIGLNRDITALKKSQLEREELSAQLTQAQKMESIGRLAGGVAHDFNNLLTVINGHSRMALWGLAPGDPLHHQFEQIRKAGERAAALTRQLLAFSRKQILQPSVLHLNAIVKDVESILSRLLGEDVEIHVSLSPEDPCVYADPHQLEQVLLNMAVNSRDAMPGGGALFIETGLADRDANAIRAHPEMRPGRYAVLAVSDTGVGMDEATRGRIFEPFFTTKGVGEGTGLGLSTVQGIVSQSGGCVNVDSEPGKGSTFRIYLPALTQAGATIGSAPAPNNLSGKETVLIVEDQDDVRDFAVTALKHYGYRVLEARNGQEALAVFERSNSKVHLLLTDVVMPGMSGPDLAARVAKVEPGIKTLFMSGYTKNFVRDALLGGQSGLVQKPFTPEQLAASVRNLLGAARPGRCILLAEPEGRARFSLRLMLEGQGHTVREVSEPNTVLEESLDGVDMVVIAIDESPEPDTIQTLRRDWPAIRILALSGFQQGPSQTKSRETGAHATLCKPITAELLADRVNELFLAPR